MAQLAGLTPQPLSDDVVPSDSPLARAAYQAYGDQADWRNYQGFPMPRWDELPRSIRESWCTAAEAVKSIVETGGLPGE